MSITTIIFIVILAFFIWRGYQKGFVGAITKVLSFIVAYPAAIFLTNSFAAVLRTHTGLDGLILFLVAGCTIFLVASLLVTLLLNGLARLVPANEFTQTSSKIGGAAFGVIFGSVVGLIVVYVIDIFIKPTNLVKQHITTFKDESTTNQQRNAEAESIKKYVVNGGVPENDSFIDTTAKKLVSTAAATAVEIITADKATTQITKTITQNPQAMLNHVQNITGNGEFTQLLSKPEFQAELNRGNIASLMQNEDFQTLMNNADMQAIMASDAIGDSSSEQAAAEKMIQAWQKVETLKNDPRVLNIVNDPNFRAQLNSQNKLPLLMNPQMRELSEIIFNSDSNPVHVNNSTKIITATSTTHYVVDDITDGIKTTDNEADTTTGIDKKTEEKPEQKLYRWIDENGKVHYSDKPVKH